MIYVHHHADGGGVLATGSFSREAVERNARSVGRTERMTVNWDIDKFLEDYRASLPIREAFRLQLESLIRALLANEGREVHHIESRCKTVESVPEKLGRKAYLDPLSDMTDLVGLRVIMYYDSDVTFAAGIIGREFAVDPAHSVDKRLPIAYDRFGYESYHLVVALDERRAGLPEWNPFAHMRAEIQVRTVLQHAWATVSHQLSYKAKSGLSEEGNDDSTGWRRRLREPTQTLRRFVPAKTRCGPRRRVSRGTAQRSWRPRSYRTRSGIGMRTLVLFVGR